MLGAGSWSSTGLRAAGTGKEGNFCYFTSKCVMKYDGLSQKVSLTIQYIACYTLLPLKKKPSFGLLHLPEEEGQTTRSQSNQKGSMGFLLQLLGRE